MNYNNHDDDFASLVSRANPAAQHRQQQSLSSYPPAGPAASNQYALDPFFDDDDDLQTPNLNQTAPSLQRQQTNTSNLIDDPLDSTADLPLTKAAVPPAGRSFTSLQQPQPQQPSQPIWTFDADDDVPNPTRFDTRNAPVRTRAKRRFPKIEWPWGKKKILAPERKIWLNDTASNDAEGYCSNYVSTTKYNLATFVPKFLFGALIGLQTLSASIVDFVSASGLQSNSRNTPICFSSSLVRLRPLRRDATAV